MDKVFAFNIDATYKAGALYAPGTPSKLAIAGPLNILVKNSTTTDTPAFTARAPDVFSQYKLPNVNSNHIVDLWSSQPMGFWQNQLNFAVWCSTSGCGVSAKYHLEHTEAMISSLYKFHVYYQVRCILAELKVALPGDPQFNVYENAYDNTAYQRICREFGVSPNTNWRRGGMTNYGLGKVYTDGHPIGDGWFFPNLTYGWRSTGGTNVWHDYNAPSGWFKESFTEPWGGNIIHADFISQDDAGANTAWSMFILDESQGFTQAGIVRLNDSIMTYVWTILGAQVQTRTAIIGTGLAFEAQKQLLALLESAIDHEVDLPSMIKRYQDVLQNARSKVDYVFGFGLYMAPSDMLLRVGKIDGYNNLIVTATAGMKLGSNAPVNAAPVPPPPPPIQGPISVHYEFARKTPDIPAATTTAAELSAVKEHQDEKTALVIGFVAIGLVFLWFRRH